MDDNLKKLFVKEAKASTLELGIEPWHMMVVEKKWYDSEASHPPQMKGGSSMETTFCK